MKLKLALAMAAVVSALVVQPAPAAEIIFTPSTQWYDIEGNGILRLWGVPEAGGNALVANPDYNWPKPTAIAAWYVTILKAQQMGLSVAVGYDPVTFDIWYVARPR